MSEYVFLFKEKNTKDRDCVKYIDLDDLKKNHLCCDGKFNVQGACFCRSLKDSIALYEDITTILTKKEYELLCNPCGDDWQEIIQKLSSKENQELFEKVKQEETEYLMDEYGFDEEDVERIFENYYLDYEDRGVVGCVFTDAYECGYEEAVSIGYINNKDDVVSRYFDFESFGNDLLMGENYLELDDGRVVYLNY